MYVKLLSCVSSSFHVIRMSDHIKPFVMILLTNIQVHHSQ